MNESNAKQKALEKLTAEKLMVSPSCLDLIIDKSISVDEVVKEASKTNTFIITEEFLRTLIKSDVELSKAAEELTGDELDEELPVEVVHTKQIYAKDVESKLVINEDRDVTGKSTCDGTIGNFVEYFNNRYKSIRKILRERPGCRAAIPIEGAKKAKGEKIGVICMITDKRESRKGHHFLELEDPTGTMTALIPGDNEKLIELYSTLLLDEVIHVHGTLRNDLFLVNEITQPDIPYSSKPNYADEEVYTAFLSDIHVGSYLFLEKEYYNFVDWLKGNRGEEEVAGRVKYIMIAGDLVDGIGIYPGQDKELTIPDIYKQYYFLAKLLEDIPDYIEIIVGMGNHDAVRGAEPQPRLDRELAESLYELPNVHVVGNPARISMHGVKALMYHGTSLDTIIGNLADCTYSSPEKAMIQYLKRRTLVPSYGGSKRSGDTIAPESVDYLAIDEVPDIFHCGHVHTNGYANYRGVKVINSGTWQAKTKYQEQLGHQPTPCRVPVMNLSNHEVAIKYFREDE